MDPSRDENWRELPAIVAFSAMSDAVAPQSKPGASLLGIFLGGFGAHKFYLGHTKAGLIRLVVAIVAVGFGALPCLAGMGPGPPTGFIGARDVTPWRAVPKAGAARHARGMPERNWVFKGHLQLMRQQMNEARITPSKEI